MLCSRSLLSARVCVGFCCSGQEKYRLRTMGRRFGGPRGILSHTHDFLEEETTLTVGEGSRRSELETHHKLNELHAVGKVFHEGGHRGVTVCLKLGV
jgi:hypothetical protein